MASNLVRAETVRTAEAIYDAIKEKEQPISAGDIAKEFNLGGGRHSDIAAGLKHLIKRDKIVKLGDGRASTYITTDKHLKPAPEQAKQDPHAAVGYQAPQAIVPAHKRARAVPVHMVEVPKATLKLIVKAVMQCCTPMDNALQRATLQCMEKLI